MSEQMRKEFEAWFEGMNLVADYQRDVFEEMFWHVWQASRQSLVVKLPEPKMYGRFLSISEDDIISALDAAGVKYE